MEDDLSVISTCVHDHTCSSGCAKQACAHPGAFVSQSVTPKSCSHTLASDLHNLLTTVFYCICQSAFLKKKVTLSATCLVCMCFCMSGIYIRFFIESMKTCVRCFASPYERTFVSVSVHICSSLGACPPRCHR